MLSVIRQDPLGAGAATQLEVPHEQTVRLLRRPSTWLWLTLSVIQALFELTLFWLMVWGTTGSSPPAWLSTTFVCTVPPTSPGLRWAPRWAGSVASRAPPSTCSAPGGVGLGRDPRRPPPGQRQGVITTTGFVAYFSVRRHIRRRRGLLLGEGGPAPRRDRAPGDRPTVAVVIPARWPCPRPCWSTRPSPGHSAAAVHDEPEVGTGGKGAQLVPPVAPQPGGAEGIGHGGRGVPDQQRHP